MDGVPGILVICLSICCATAAGAMLACMKPQKSGQTLRFLRRNAPVALDNIAADRTLLDVLREEIGRAHV